VGGDVDVVINNTIGLISNSDSTQSSIILKMANKLHIVVFLFL